MMVLIDNFDSFVHNIARYVRCLGADCRVVRNNAVTLADLERMNPSGLMISPGPCTPLEAGISMAAIRHFGPEVPILGICLGHQAIGQVYGGQVMRAQNPMHGKRSWVSHEGEGIFQGLESPLAVGRYHSLIVSPQAFPEALKITARCERGEIMGLQHRDYPVFGVQFHPESILTPSGEALLQNFLAVTRRK